MNFWKLDQKMLQEVSPPGWSGTVAAMLQKHPEINNPWALAWYMKNKKKAKSHYKEQPNKDSQHPRKARKKKDKNKK